jgi:NADPH-dependent 2,4-dienoyl-CoA reductase/sulfur reductase-like enzyme
MSYTQDIRIWRGNRFASRARKIVVVGAGLGGVRAATALRQEGHEGRIVLVGDELELPYDRPPLSKEVLLGTRTPESTRLQPPARLAELGVELRLGAAVHGLDLARSRVLVGRDALEFDGLVLATGSSARRIDALGERSAVHHLRTLADACSLRAALDRAGHVTIVGAGFVGAEVASSVRKLGLEVTMLELDRAPFVRTFGPGVGGALARLHRDCGTVLREGVTVERVEDDEGRTLRLTDGTILETDLVVVGVGAALNTAWLESSGLQVGDGVVCDASLNAGPPRVFAIGDVASWPNALFGRRMRVEHWTNAGEQARHAARNLVHGTDTPYVSSTYFWSDQYGHRITFTGSPAADEILVVDGTPGEGPFLAWYRAGNRLVGAFALDSTRLLVQSKLLIESWASWTEALGALESQAPERELARKGEPG